MSGKFLIILFYYNRPLLVKQALRSVVEQEEKNWEIALIDDGSEIHADGIVTEVVGKTDRIKIYRINDTPEEKMTRNGVNGSMMGKYGNIAMEESDADYVVMLCDDDALYPGYLQTIKNWFENNPEKNYVYSHIKSYNPRKESAKEPMPLRPHSLNKTATICPYYALDMSQIAFRRKPSLDAGIRFRFPYTVNIDAELFLLMHKFWGDVTFSGIIGQYKAIYDDSLSHRMGQVLGGFAKDDSVYKIGVK